MQFFIFSSGVVIFAFFQFVEPPLFFNPIEAEKAGSAQMQHLTGSLSKPLPFISGKVWTAFIIISMPAGRATQSASRKKGSGSQASAAIRCRASERSRTCCKRYPSSGHNDVNYIFLTFVLSYLPLGLVGLVFACVFTASMSSSSGELSALAATSVIDIYKRFVRPNGSEQHYVRYPVS